MAINHISSSSSSMPPLGPTLQHSHEQVTTSQPIRLTAADSAKPLQKVLAADIESVANALLDEIDNRCRGLNERARRGWSLLSGSQRELNNLKRANKILNAHICPIMEKCPKDSLSGKVRPDTVLSSEDVARISRALDVAAKALPTGELRELTGLLGQYLKTSWKQMKVDQLKEGIINELEPLRKPETYKATTRSIDAKLSIGTPVIEVNDHTLVPLSASTKHALGIGKKTEIYTDPEGLVFLNHHSSKSTTNGGNAKLDLGKVVNANVDGSVKVVKDDVKLEMFNTIEDLVEKKADSTLLSHANRDEYKDIAKFSIWDKIQQKVSSAVDQKHFPSSPELSNLENDQQHMADNKVRLNELLKNVLHFQDVDISAPTPNRARALAGTSSTITATAAAKGGTAAAGASANINMSVSRSLFDFHLYVPGQFSDVIQKNTQRLNEIPQELIQHAQDALDLTAPKSPERQQAAVAKLLDLTSDLNRYYDVVQALDGLRHRHKSNIATKDSQQEKSLVNEKHQLENKWQTIGRHGFLQTLSASHALLSVNAMSADGEFSEQATSAIKDAADSLRNPKIQHDKGRLNRSAAFQKDIILQNRSTSVTAGADLGGYGVSGSLSYSREWLHRIHPSRVRQGDYVNKTWTATGNVSASDAVHELASRLQSSTGDNATLQELSDILSSDSTDLSYSQSRSRLTREYLPEYRADDNYAGDKDYQTQFTRTTKTTTIKGKVGGTGPVAPGFNIGASAGYERAQRVTLNQQIGTDDLSYVLNILNRMDKNRAASPQALEGFYAENKAQFSEMFTKMGNAGSGIYQEAQYFLDELIDRAAGSEREQSLRALSTIHNGEQRVGQKDMALKALSALTAGDSDRATRNNAIQVLRDAVRVIPWNRIQEATPPKGTLATLGFGGKTVAGHKVIPGEKLSTKQEKAEKALSTLEKALASGDFYSQSRKSPGSKTKDAVKTLTRLFDTLGNEAGFDKARIQLTGLIKQAPLTDAQREQAGESLDTLVAAHLQTENAAAETDLQAHFEILDALINAHSTGTGAKDAASEFKQRFNAAMADYRANPNAENLASAKAAFFDFHSRQMAPWNEAHASTWLDVPFSRKAAEGALDTGTRVLKKMGLHSRVAEQRQMRSQTATPPGQPQDDAPGIHSVDPQSQRLPQSETADSARNLSASPSSDSLYLSADEWPLSENESPSPSRSASLNSEAAEHSTVPPQTGEAMAETASAGLRERVTLAELMAQDAVTERTNLTTDIQNEPVPAKRKSKGLRAFSSDAIKKSLKSLKPKRKTG